MSLMRAALLPALRYPAYRANWLGNLASVVDSRSSADGDGGTPKRPKPATVSLIIIGVTCLSDVRHAG